jgi:hypothetical protein
VVEAKRLFAHSAIEIDCLFGNVAPQLGKSEIEWRHTKRRGSTLVVVSIASLASVSGDSAAARSVVQVKAILVVVMLKGSSDFNPCHENVAWSDGVAVQRYAEHQRRKIKY